MAYVKGDAYANYAYQLGAVSAIMAVSAGYFWIEGTRRGSSQAGRKEAADAAVLFQLPWMAQMIATTAVVIYIARN
jgi:hypothetical protein